MCGLSYWLFKYYVKTDTQYLVSVQIVNVCNVIAREIQCLQVYKLYKNHNATINSTQIHITTAPLV